MAASILIAYGAGALEGYGSSATACSTAAGGTQIDGGSGIYLVSMHIDGSEYGFFFASDDTEGGPSFYGDGPPTNQTHDFVAGDFVYVPGQTLTTAIGTILTLTAGWYEIVFLGEFAYGIYYNPSGEVLAQPTACPAPSSEEINFTTGTYAPNYLTSSDTFTYGVIRTDATAAPLFVEIDISASSTAVEGIDYTRPLNTELTLSWAGSTDGTETFNVTTLVNPAYTASTFIPYIRSSSIADIVGTASYASSSIIYPGEIDFPITGSEVLEGSNYVVTLRRTTGSDGSATASLAVGGTAVEDDDYTLTNLTIDTAVATAAFGWSEDEYNFTVHTIADDIDTGSLSLTFTFTGVEYPLSGTQYYPEGGFSGNTTFTLTILDNATGSVNFHSDYTGTLYITASTIEYSVVRSEGGDFAATAEIDLASSNTAVEGIDYTGSSTPLFPVTLSWADQEQGSKTFDVSFLENTAYTGTLFIPEITDTENTGIGTASFSSGSIVYPGKLDFKITGSTIVEGAAQVVTIDRTSGTYSSLTATIVSGGTAIGGGSDYSISGITFIGDEASVEFGDGDSSFSFTVTTVDDAADEGNETITFEIDSIEYPLSGSRYYPTASIGTGTTNIITIIDNESGSVNFGVASDTVAQSSSIIITVNRSGGGDYAATATMDQSGGTAEKNVDYTGLPATVYWEDQQQGNKTFTITTINPWSLSASLTVPIVFSSLTNVEEGTTIAQETLTITNNVTSECTPSNPEVSKDQTINTFKNLTCQHVSKTDQVPFALGIKGPSTLRKRNAAYSISAGKQKSS